MYIVGRYDDILRALPYFIKLRPGTVQASPSGWVYHLVLNAPKPRGVASSKGEKTLENEVTNEK